MEGFQPPTSSFVASCGMQFRHMGMVRTEVFTGYSSTSPQHWEHSIYIHQHFHHCICIYKEFHHFHVLDLPPTPLTASCKIYEYSIRPVSGLYPGASEEIRTLAGIEYHSGLEIRRHRPLGDTRILNIHLL